MSSGCVFKLKVLSEHEGWSLGTLAVAIGFVCCYHLAVQGIVVKAFAEAILIPSQAILRQFPFLDLHEYPLPLFELRSGRLGARSQGLPVSVCILFIPKLCSMLCRGFEPMQTLQQVAELLRGSKSMIEHHVSHMSITDERLEEHETRHASGSACPFFLLDKLLCFVVGLRVGQLMTISQVMVGAPPFKPLIF